MMLRKTGVHHKLVSAYPAASMRPQHDAAENDRGAALAASGKVASMRPQHDAAENVRLLRRSQNYRPRFNEAAA